MRLNHRAIGTLLVVCVLAGAGRIGAQGLTGTVTDAGVRVPGAIVLLLAPDGAVVARAVSRADGGFRVSATAEGRYTVRVLRIGFRPTIAGPVELHAGITTSRDIALSSRVWLLPEVQVTDRGQCQIHPDTNTAAFRLWDAARTALLAAVLTESEPLGVRITRSDRTLDASGRNVLDDSSSTLDGTSRHPTVTLPADSLARNGYATYDDRGGTTYWGPDANVLLSESFASSHCIHAELPPADTGSLAGVLGVAFDPAAPRGTRVDVRGVLWVDRTSAELRSFDYAYVNVPSIAERAGAGGHIEFLRLPDGTWTISRWSIRLPIIETTISREPSTIPGSAPTQRSNQRLVAIRDSHSDLLELKRAGSTWWERGRVSVAIRVTDSTGGPVRALVSLNDTSRSVATADDGVVRFDRVLPGPARVDVRVPALDSIGAARIRAAVTIPDHPFEPLAVRVPSAQEVFATRCGAEALEWNEGAVRGALGRGRAANVEVSWDMPYARLGGGAPIVVHEARNVAGDATGRYFLCGVPRGIPLTIRIVEAASAGDRPRVGSTEVPPGAFVAIVDFDR